MSTLEQLQAVFSDNFCFYWLSHSSHVNITGRNFVSDHKLLQKVYEDSQAQIDTIAEFIRTMNGKVPTSLIDIADASSITVTTSEYDTADELLQSVLDGLEQLVSCYVELYESAEDEKHPDISNYAADRISVNKKYIWMLRSTLE
jgi:DNA-binding ferritin-like protein